MAAPVRQCMITALLPSAALAATTTSVIAGGKKLDGTTDMHVTTDSANGVVTLDDNESNYNLRNATVAGAEQQYGIGSFDRDYAIYAEGELKLALVGANTVYSKDGADTRAGICIWYLGVANDGSLTAAGSGSLHVYAAAGANHAHNGIIINAAADRRVKVTAPKTTGMSGSNYRRAFTVPPVISDCHQGKGVYAGHAPSAMASVARTRGTPPGITSLTANKTVSVTVANTGTISATASDATGYQWYQNTDGEQYFSPTGSTTGASDTTAPVTLANNGYRYYCTTTGAGVSVNRPRLYTERDGSRYRFATRTATPCRGCGRVFCYWRGRACHKPPAWTQKTEKQRNRAHTANARVPARRDRRLHLKLRGTVKGARPPDCIPAAPVCRDNGSAQDAVSTCIPMAAPQ